MTAFCNHFIRVDLCDVCSPIKDPRDADLARLKAEVERLTAGQHRCEWCAETFPLVPRQMSEPAVDRGVCPQCKVERFRRDLAAHKRALAAGPAALRAKYAGYKGGIVKGAYDQSADLVERAQADAMKEEP